MDLDSKDKRGSTPLHWACFQSSEISLLYLLEWLDKDQIDLQDQDGYTAVHLAIKTAESLKSGRPLRALL
jgi:ankyrin repeat protein